MNNLICNNGRIHGQQLANSRYNFHFIIYLFDRTIGWYTSRRDLLRTHVYISIIGGGRKWLVDLPLARFADAMQSFKQGPWSKIARGWAHTLMYRTSVGSRRNQQWHIENHPAHIVLMCLHISCARPYILAHVEAHTRACAAFGQS